MSPRKSKVVPDSAHRGMWRVRWPDGRLSDMTNLTRAKDAVACFMEIEERRSAGGRSRQKGACASKQVRSDNGDSMMTNEEIISLARSTIQNGRDLVNVMNNADHECGLPLLVAYNLLRGHHAQVGIPDGPEHDGKLDRCRAIAEMLGAYHAKLRIDGPDCRQYLDAFIPSDRPEIRRRIRDSLALIGGTICDFH